jgi:hypothetical protein
MIRTVHGHLADLGPVDRQVLLIRLANELEHQLDLGGLYLAESKKEQKGHQQYMERYGAMLPSMAERLGFSTLAEEIAKVCKNIRSAQILFFLGIEASTESPTVLRRGPTVNGFQ